MFRIFFSAVIVVALLHGGVQISSDQTFSGNTYPADTSLTLIFTGDIMQHQTQIDCAWDDTLMTYFYDSCFKYVAPIIRNADIAIGNFEFTLGGKPYTGYPQFSAPEQIVKALVFAGFDIMGTANNHSCDRSSKGLERTIHILDSAGIIHSGTFINRATRDSTYPLIINKNGIKVALLVYTYGTNGLPVPEPFIVNLIDRKQIEDDLAQAKDSLPDKTIIYIHWGDEYKSQPNAFQEELAAFCFEKGADIIIGSHPHVIERMERYTYQDSTAKEVLIAYSLGNYVSNQRERYRDGGAMLQLTLTKQNGITNISDAGYYFTWVYTPLEQGKKKFYIVPVSRFENQPELLDKESYQKMMIFAADSRKLYESENRGIKEYTWDPVSALWVH